MCQTFKISDFFHTYMYEIVCPFQLMFWIKIEIQCEGPLSYKWYYLSFSKKYCTCSEKRFLRIACFSVIDKNPVLDWIYTQRVITDLLWQSGARSRTFWCLHQYRVKSTTECALCNYCFANLFDRKKVSKYFTKQTNSPNITIFATVILSYE